MAFLTKTLVVCLVLICASQALSHYHHGMMHGMRYPDMMGMDMGFTGIMGMPYGMFKEGDDETAAEQEGSIDAAFVPEGAEIHDQQTPQRRFDLDDIAISDQVKKDSLAGSESVR